MKPVHRIMFGVFLLLLGSGVARAQITIPGQPNNSQLAPEKRIGRVTATLLKHKNQDQITVQTDPLYLQGDTNNGIVLIANFISFGKTLAPPAAIDFEFVSYSKRRRFSVSRKFQIYRNGALVFTGMLARNSSGRALNGVITEVVTQKLPYAEFLRLTDLNAQTFALGGMKLDLDKVTLEALRDLRKSIESSLTFP